MLSSVDLPDPEGPITVTNSPRSAWKSTASSATIVSPPRV
jgi:hypothetical protein